MLIGAGNMAVEYAKVFIKMERPFIVIGRGSESARRFTQQTGVPVLTGEMKDILIQLDEIPSTAIVAVSLESLAEVTIELIRRGVERILVEKPAGLTPEEIDRVAQVANHYEAKVFVAYNRRFYASVMYLAHAIELDGGVASFHFEFTEWSHVVVRLDKPKNVLANWFYANSTHVLDLAFYLGGKPSAIATFKAGALEWHPDGSIFSGAGVTERGALFSYHSNWESVGRWGVEILTRKRKYILRPLEKVRVQEIGSLEDKEVEIDDRLDKMFKPGLYKQTETFLEGHDWQLLNINEQANNVSEVYKKIIG